MTQQHSKNKMYRFVLIAIIIFSFILKTYQLDTNPAGFFADEASVGYDAYLIFKTGRERHGELFPLFFKGFNFDNVSPYQVYFTLPFVAAFGLTEKAVRLAPVTFSLLELLFFYLLLKEFIPKPFSLFGTFLLSISPWHFHISRINMGDYYSWTLLTLIAYYFLLRALRANKIFLFIVSAIFFGLATYSYTPARLITPLLFTLSLAVLVSIKRCVKASALMIVLYIMILLPFIHFHISDPHSLQRIKDTMGIDIKKQELANTKGDVMTHFLQKYILHYSDDFLFQKGDADFPGQTIRRHSISGLGLLYYYQKWLIIIGFAWLLFQIIKKRKYELLFIIILLLLFPLADSLSLDKTPFATRSYLGILPMHMLVAFGIFGLFKLLTNLVSTKASYVNFFFILSFLTISIFSVSILVQRFKENPTSTSDFWGWQYGARDIVNYFSKNQDKYDELLMAPEFNSPEIFFKFYSPTDCSKCRIGLPDSSYNPTLNQLFALTPSYLTSNPQFQMDVIKTIYYPNKTIAFKIGKVVKR